MSFSDGGEEHKDMLGGSEYFTGGGGILGGIFGGAEGGGIFGGGLADLDNKYCLHPALWILTAVVQLSIIVLIFLMLVGAFDFSSFGTVQGILWGLISALAAVMVWTGYSLYNRKQSDASDGVAGLMAAAQTGDGEFAPLERT